MKKKLDLLTVRQAAELLGVARPTVYSAMQRYEAGDMQALPFTRVGRTIILNREEVEAYKVRSQPGGEVRVGRPKKAKREEGSE